MCLEGGWKVDGEEVFMVHGGESGSRCLMCKGVECGAGNEGSSGRFVVRKG